MDPHTHCPACGVSYEHTKEQLQHAIDREIERRGLQRAAKRRRYASMFIHGILGSLVGICCATLIVLFIVLIGAPAILPTNHQWIIANLHWIVVDDHVQALTASELRLLISIAVAVLLVIALCTLQWARTAPCRGEQRLRHQVAQTIPPLHSTH